MGEGGEFSEGTIQVPQEPRREVVFGLDDAKFWQRRVGGAVADKAAQIEEEGGDSYRHERNNNSPAARVESALRQAIAEAEEAKSDAVRLKLTQQERYALEGVKYDEEKNPKPDNFDFTKHQQGAEAAIEEGLKNTEGKPMLVEKAISRVRDFFSKRRAT